MSQSTSSHASRTPVPFYSSSSCPPELSYPETPPPSSVDTILRRLQRAQPSRMETDKAFWDRHTMDKPPKDATELHVLTMKRLYGKFPPLEAIDNPTQKAGFPLMPGRYLLLVSGVNSLTQRIYTWLKDAGLNTVSLSVMVYSPGKKMSPRKEEELLLDIDRFAPDIILCPYLTTKVPQCVYNKYLTLVFHPGPPGDGGPSSLDWLLLGDDGEQPDAKLALERIQNAENIGRDRWGGMVFQATAKMDAGPVWAWEEYRLPTDNILTKAQLYQSLNLAAALNCFEHAVARVWWTVGGVGFLDKSRLWVDRIGPIEELENLAISTHKPFSGGPLHYRPLLTVSDREIDIQNWTAADIMIYVNASDSQPGARLRNLTPDSTTSLFVYGAQLGGRECDIPIELYQSLGYQTLDEVPNGTAIATRDGAILFKTCPLDDDSLCSTVWITMGRVIRPLGQALEAKIPLTKAVTRAGHGSFLDGVYEWPLDWEGYRPYEWQEIYVTTEKFEDLDSEGETVTHLVQYVYWDFYNGAMTTEKCRLLLEVLLWATHPERGEVKLLVLMGGHYFSNGIALNTIEDEVTDCELAGIPDQVNTYAGIETWRNINAIDDIVEFLAGDTHAERSPFLQNFPTLCERGIATVACIRGNAAAGGVALAAACDNVWASDRVTINPAYRAMGLHGSEFHSWSYVERCGEVQAGELLRSMLPISAREAQDVDLVDQVYTWRPNEPHGVPEHAVKSLVQRLLKRSPCTTVISAPWVCSSVSPGDRLEDDGRPPLLIDWMCQNKRDYFAQERSDWINPPLLHHRNEELSQMLLDCFHPTRSLRYHTRRRAFIRKFKTDKTPTRYLTHLHDSPDPEDTEEFDDTGPWRRGSEWRFVNQLPPASLETSGWTQVPLFPDASRDYEECLTDEGMIAHRQEIVRAIQEKEASMVEADMPPIPGMISSISNSTIGDILRSPQISPTELAIQGAEIEGAKQVVEHDQLPTTSESSHVSKTAECVDTIHPCFFNDPAAH